MEVFRCMMWKIEGYAKYGKWHHLENLSKVKKMPVGIMVSNFTTLILGRLFTLLKFRNLTSGLKQPALVPMFDLEGLGIRHTICHTTLEIQPFVEACVRYGNNSLGEQLVNRLSSPEEVVEAFISLGYACQTFSRTKTRF